GVDAAGGRAERSANGTRVGEAGQGVRGFLAKLGLARSSLCLNAFPYGSRRSRSDDAPDLLREPHLLSWRNDVYDAARSGSLQAIVAFGANARIALELWPGRPNVRQLNIPHPSSHDAQQLLQEWHQAVNELRPLIGADPDG